MKTSLLQLGIALAGLTAATAIDFDMRLDPNDLSINQLTIQTEASDPAAVMAWETDGLAISDRVEFKIPTGLTFVPITAPAGWSWQSNIIPATGGGSVQLIVYYLAGIDPANDFEFHNFATPWELTFRLTQPIESGGEPTAPFDLALRARVLDPFAGLIPGTWIEPSTAAVTKAEVISVQVNVRLEPVGACGVGMRFHEIRPGIRYVIESSVDLINWSERQSVQSSTLAENVLLLLDEVRDPRDFFRVVPVPLTNS